MPRPGAVWAQLSVVLLQRAIKKQRVDPHVVVKVFHVPQRLDRASHVGMKLWSAVGRERNVERLAHRGDF